MCRRWMENRPHSFVICVIVRSEMLWLKVSICVGNVTDMHTKQKWIPVLRLKSFRSPNPLPVHRQMAVQILPAVSQPEQIQYQLIISHLLKSSMLRHETGVAMTGMAISGTTGHQPDHMPRDPISCPHPAVLPHLDRTVRCQ